MVAQPKSVIKSYFEQGDVPTQAQFVDLIDSYMDVSATPAFTGTVTSVGLAMPSIFAVTGNPITSAGTIAVALSAQSASQIFASPVSGAAAAPTFRGMIHNDLPRQVGNSILLNATTSASTPEVFTVNTSSFVGRIAGNIVNLAFGTGFSFSGNTVNIAAASSSQLQMTVDTSAGTSTFTTSGNITASTKFLFIITGGGGGGGAGATAQAGPGGGAGATCFFLVTGLAASTGYTYKIGVSGAAGAAGAGGNGGDSFITIGTPCSAHGGVGGVQGTTSGASGGVGGVATAGTLNINGGGGGASNSASTTLATPGVGGVSFWGGGNAAIISATQTGTGAYGAGGTGGGDDGGGATSGAAGNRGCFVALWLE